MQDADAREFREVIQGVYSFYARECTPFAVDVWWQALRPYDLAAVRHALGRHAVNPDTGQFIPKPADVVKMLEGNSVSQAMQAWAKVETAIKHVGTYQTVVFDDALIHAVVADMGGWEALGQITTGDLPFRVREFEKRYQGYKLKPPATYLRALVGICERTNGSKYRSAPPVLIGDKAKAEVVYRGGSTQLAIGMQPMKLLAEEQAA